MGVERKTPGYRPTAAGMPKSSEHGSNFSVAEVAFLVKRVLLLVAALLFLRFLAS